MFIELPLLIFALVVIVLDAGLYFDFLFWLASQGGLMVRWRRIADKFVMALVIGVLWEDKSQPNDCCSDSALFSPQHRLTAVVLILVCMAAYFYSTFRRKMAPPLVEIVINCLLLAGIALDICVGVQMNDAAAWLGGIVPVCMLFIIALGRNHALAKDNLALAVAGDSQFLSLCRKLIFLPAWQKMPILLVLCLPLLAVTIGMLLLFGQKPDSVIRAFTDTYKHGFSQLDYECAGVVCNGHFLCTVATQGHRELVKPIRPGVRAGKQITCNRQLLVSNAFEELLEQRAPRVHRVIRRLYNRVGRLVHRYYVVFRNVWVADVVYLLMKPLEAIFLIVLYCCDRNPENRIAQQYLRREDRAAIALADSNHSNPDGRL